MATFYWRGGSGRFDLAAGWQVANAYGTLSPAGAAPGNADTAVLDTAGMTLTADCSFGGLLRLDLPSSAGALDLGGNTLTLLNTAQFGDAGSAVTGPGTLATEAISAVPPLHGGGAAVLLSGGATWSNAGLVMDAGVVALGGGAGDSATVINQSGALWALATDHAGQLRAAAGSPNPGFVNAGTLAKTAGNGLSSVTVPVTNTGVIDAESGTLELDAGGVLGGTIGGDAGRVRLAGTFALPAGTDSVVSFAAGAQLGGAAAGAAILAGPGTLTSSGAVRLTDWNGAQLVLTGGATWNNGGSVTAAAGLVLGAAPGDGATLVNQSGAWFGLAGDAGIGVAAPGRYELINAGTLSKTGGAGSSRIAVPVTDTGSIAIGGGTLEFDAGGSFAGPISGTGMLAFGGGVGTLDASAHATMSGLEIDGGTLQQSGTVSLTNAASVAAGTLALAGGVLNAPALAIAAAGAVQGYGTLTAALADAGRVEAAGGTLVLAGTLSGAGQVRIDPDAVLQLGATTNAGRLAGSAPMLNSGTVLAAAQARATVAGAIAGSGTVLLAGQGTLTLGGAVDASQTIAFGGTGATLTVTDIADFAPAAILGFTTGDTLLVADSAAHVAASLPALESLATSGMLTAISLTDPGTPGLALTADQVSADADALARIVTPYRVVSATDWAAHQSGSFGEAANWGGGTVPDAAADAAIDAPGQTVTVGGGSFAVHSLSNLAGTLMISAGTLDLGALENGAIVDWNGGSVVLDGGVGANPTLLNDSGGMLDIAANGQALGRIGTGGSVANAGTLRVDGGSGAVTFDPALRNTGSIVVTQGTLALNGGGSSPGDQIRAGAGATLAFGGGAFVVTDGTYAVANTMVDGGTLDLSAASAASSPHLQLTAGALRLGAQSAAVQHRMTQTGGTLSGSGTLTAYGGAQLTGGVQTGPGDTRLLGDSSIGGGLALDGGRVVQNDGILTWSAGGIVLGGGDPAASVQSGTLTNAGVLRITATGMIGPAAGGSGVLDNAGVITVAGAGETDIDATLVNQGLIQVAHGTLSLNGGGRSSGGELRVDTAAVLRLGAPADGAGGAFRITGGTYGVADTVLDGGTLDLSGATGIGPAATLSLDHAGALLLGRLTATVGSVGLADAALVAGGGTLTAAGGAQLGDGVLRGTGTLALQGLSTITGAVQVQDGYTLQNDGTLSWSGGAVALGSAAPNAMAQAGTLINSAGGQLRVATDGTITAPRGGALINAGTLTKSGTSGLTDIAAAVRNDGTVAAQSGTIALEDAVSGSGTFLIEGAKLDFAGIVGGGETIRFLGGGTLTVETTGTFGGAVAGLAAGATLDLTGLAFGPDLACGFAPRATGGTLTVTDGTHGAALSLLGTYTPAGFQLGSDGHGGVLVKYA